LIALYLNYQQQGNIARKEKKMDNHSISENFENFVTSNKFEVNISESSCYSFCMSAKLDDFAEVVLQVSSSGLLYVYMACWPTQAINLFSEDCPDDILQRIYNAYEEMCFQDFYNYVVEWSDITMSSFESYK
jgi:NADPH-dependent 7-cyano-7-deazaguanine reductase QueF